jgi:nucleotide-binding universal stress UspA family protein
VSKEEQKVGIFPTKILLAIDDSKEADPTIRKAVELATSTSSELHLVYVGCFPTS